jgi:hypothetical protein
MAGRFAPRLFSCDRRNRSLPAELRLLPETKDIDITKY